MKKIYLLLLLGVGIVSCTEKEEFEQETNEVNTSKLKYAADGKYDLLGHGYDATGVYLDPTSTKRLVVDIDAFLRDNPGRLDLDESNGGDVTMYVGATASDFINDITKKVKKNKGSTNQYFSSTITKEKEYQTKYSYSTKYSFGRADVWKQVKKLSLYTDVAALAKYTTGIFKEDANKLSPEDLIKVYGTHVLSDITIGGRLTFLIRSEITEETNMERKREIISSTLSYQTSNYGSSTSGGVKDDENTKTLIKKNATWNTSVTYHGGTHGGLSYTFNQETGHPTTTFNLSSWESSVNERNARLVDIEWEKAYPIYEFVPEDKKEITKLAVEKYIKDKEIKEVELSPVYIYTQSGSQYLNTTLLCPVGSIHPTFGINEGVYFYTYKEQDQGTMPLYQYRRPNGRHFYTTIKYSDLGANSPFGTNEQILGYVYNSEMTNTIPVYIMRQRFYLSNRLKTDYFYFSKENTPSRAQKVGKKVWIYYDNEGLVGHVLK